MECIETILRGIEVGCFFDSHYVYGLMIRDFTNDYLRVVQSIDSKTNNLVLRTHQKIGHLIVKFEGILVER